MEIAIDFDGTCVTHEYPNIGKNIGAEKVLRMLVERGHKLILYTMRSGDKLVEAGGWFSEHNIPLYGCQFNPTQKEWTQSPKCYAQLYIDDAALGCPLKYSIDNVDYEPRPFVDWVEVEHILYDKGIL